MAIDAWQSNLWNDLETLAGSVSDSSCGGRTGFLTEFPGEHKNSRLEYGHAFADH